MRAPTWVSDEVTTFVTGDENQKCIRGLLQDIVAGRMTLSFGREIRDMKEIGPFGRRNARTWLHQCLTGGVGR